MNRMTRFEPRGFPLAVALTAAIVLLGIVGSAQVACGQPPWVLTHNNSSITVDPTLQATVYDWEVDNVHHLKEVSNWYRIGDFGREHSVHTLSVGPVTPSDTNGDSVDDRLSVTYTHPQFLLTIEYGVTGGPLLSGYSKMGERISITNTTSSDLEIHFFEYFDLDLTETPYDDLARPLTTATGEQYDATTYVHGGVIDADHYEYTTWPNTLTHLTDTGPSLLSDTPPYGTAVGPDNVTIAIQWDFDDINPIRPAIGPGQTVVIEKDWECQMSFGVPEPASGSLAVFGFLALLPAFGRRRR